MKKTVKVIVIICLICISLCSCDKKFTLLYYDVETYDTLFPGEVYLYKYNLVSNISEPWRELPYSNRKIILPTESSNKKIITIVGGDH